MQLPKCPECSSEYTYEDNGLYICPMCYHEWSTSVEVQNEGIKDAYGNTLNDGDSVTVIKDLKVKGASAPLKQNTTIKNIRIQDNQGPESIMCKVDGFGTLFQQQKFLKRI